MRTSRTTLAVLATLPLAATLAACSTTPSAPVPGSPSTSASSSPSGSTSPSGSSSKPSGSSSDVVGGVSTGPATRTTATGRPSVSAALDTVGSYMTREIGMTRPVTGPFRWTGTGTGEVTVRPRLVKGGLGPRTIVSVTRLRTVWYVAGARTDGVAVDRAALGRPITELTRVSGTLPDPGIWRVEITEDRYGPDIWLGGTVLAGGAGRFTAPVVMGRAHGATGSIILREKADSADGTLRAEVIRVRFVPGPPPAPCAPSRLLPVLQGWFDDPAVELRVARVRVPACRNGFAHVIAVPRVNPKGHSQYDSLTLYLQDTAGQWRTLGDGSDVSCDEPQVAPACRALGEVK